MTKNNFIEVSFDPKNIFMKDIMTHTREFLKGFDEEERACVAFPVGSKGTYLVADNNHIKGLAGDELLVHLSKYKVVCTQGAEQLQLNIGNISQAKYGTTVFKDHLLRA